MRKTDRSTCSRRARNYLLSKPRIALDCQSSLICVNSPEAVRPDRKENVGPNQHVALARFAIYLLLQSSV